MKQNFVSIRGNPNGFPLRGAPFQGTPYIVRRVHPFRQPKYRQIGLRGGKAWFSLREKLFYLSQNLL